MCLCGLLYRRVCHTCGKERICRKKHLHKASAFGGIPTAIGYNAPCLEDMVHCFAISDSGYRDNEDEKDKPVAIIPNCRNSRAFLHSRTGTGIQRPEYAINP